VPNGNTKINWSMVGAIIVIFVTIAGSIGGYAVAKNNIDINKKTIEKTIETCEALIDKTQTNKESIIKIDGKLDNISTQQKEFKEALVKQNAKLEEILRKLP